MADLPHRLRAFVLAVCGSSLIAIALIVTGFHPAYFEAHPLQTLALAGCIVVGELLPIRISRGDTHDEITVSTTFAIALTLIGPLWLAVLAIGFAVAVQDGKARRGVVKISFNVAQYTLTLFATRAAYCALTGDSLLHPPGDQVLSLPNVLPAALAAGVVFFLVNNTLIGVVTAFAFDVPVLSHLREDLRFQVTTSGVLSAFAPVVAGSVQTTIWLLPLLALPIAAIYKSAQMAAEREQEALHDTLTGLPNRELFRMRVQRACGEDARAGRRTAVMLVDLDHFKEINDTLGHHVGDDLLRVVAARIASSLRPNDMVARLGGDEFAVMAVDLAGEADALAVADRLQRSLDEPFDVDDVRLDVQASIGIALCPDHGTTMELLLQRADIAMYAAKVDRGTIQLYDVSADVHTPQRLTLAAELRDGLERDELFLEYQPKVDVTSGSTVGFEALVRWQHPRHGRMMPDEFLPVVENTGLIGPLTLKVLSSALAAAADWHAAGVRLPVSVNLSVRHLTDLSLPQHIAGLLDQHGLPPGALVLEVTETLIMNDPVRSLDVLQLLHDLGVKLAIDDFGTGYSSLAYLRRLDVDELKIDKSFVLQLATEEGNAIIVRSTIELGHNLGLRLVAEGVEDQVSLDLLRAWGCDSAQGYFFSRPLPLAEVLPWTLGRLVPPQAVIAC